MAKRQPVGVQRMAAKLDRPPLVRTEDIATLADQRVTAQPRLDANLIALARVQAHFDERRLGKRLQHPILAAGVDTLRIARVRFLLDRRALVPHETIPPLSGRRIGMSVDDSPVDARGLAAPELHPQVLLRARVRRKDDESRRVLIDPVDDQRATLAMRSEMIFDELVDRWRGVTLV